MDWLLFLTGALAGWSVTVLVWICIRTAYHAAQKRKRIQKKKWPVEEFRRRQAGDFGQFKNQCEPAALLEDPVKRARLSGKTDSVEAIQETFRSILSLSFRELKSGLQTDDYNAYTVMCAFGWRAMKINEKLNCITEVIKEAFDVAAALDERFAGKCKPELFGMPFSVKSNFYVSGYDATVGLAKLLNKREHGTCAMVQFLVDQGAVPFCLTNVPQGLLSYITSNPLYGFTKNPWDFTRTPGGSSGGEGALVAAGGASFGIGNDLVGSLRIPAAFCGLVSLKPGQNRLDEDGMNPGLPGRGRLGLSSGFYTKNVTDQEFLLRLIIGNPDFRKLRPQSSPAQLAPIVEESDHSAMCIGWFVNDGFTTVSESNKRAVIEMRDRLRKEGYTIKEFKMQDVAEEFPPEAIADMLFRNAMPDNGAYLSDMYSYEKVDKYMAKFTVLIQLRQSTVISWLLRNLGVPIARWKLSKAVACLGNAYNSDFESLRENQEHTDTFRLKWIQYWRSLGIDALICPSFITPAQPFEYPAWLTTGCFITGLFNMLDVPAGVVPVEEVGRIENNDFQDKGDFLLQKQKKALENTAGLPNAVQVVALPNEEETCLKVMKIVERLSDGVSNLRWIEERDNEPVVDRHDPNPELWEATRYFERVPRQL